MVFCTFPINICSLADNNISFVSFSVVYLVEFGLKPPFSCSAFQDHSLLSTSLALAILKGTNDPLNIVGFQPPSFLTIGLLTGTDGSGSLTNQFCNSVLVKLFGLGMFCSWILVLNEAFIFEPNWFTQVPGVIQMQQQLQNLYLTSDTHESNDSLSLRGQ